MLIKVLDCTTDPLFIISQCARTCYQSEDKDELKKREGFVRGIIKRGHTSPLEFAHITLDVKGVSRCLLAQLTRHRVGTSFCVESQRYCDTFNNDSVIPLSVQKADDNYMSFIRKSREYYKQLVEAGVPKEDARYFLPQSTTCNLKVKFNFRALRHFLKLRLDVHAQWEIRNFAQEIKQICIDKGWNWLVEDL